MKPTTHRLSRRERQIMDAVYSRGKASVAEVLEALPDPPSYSAVRALMRILEEKGHLRHLQEGQRYLYQPTQPRQSAARSAIDHVVATFFGGSIEQAVTALLTNKEKALSDDEVDRLSRLIEDARQAQAVKREVSQADEKRQANSLPANSQANSLPANSQANSLPANSQANSLPADSGQEGRT